MNQLYKWYDMQEEENFHTGTLYDAKLWLKDFWAWTDTYEGEYLHREHNFDRFMLDITKATFSELFEMMAGIDWTIEEIDKTEKELLEIKSIELENGR